MIRAAVLALALAGGSAAADCVEVPARSDWVALPSDGPILDAYAAGSWSAGAELGRVGARGYAEAEAPRVAEVYPLGALLIASAAKRVWSYADFSRTVMGAMLAGRPFAPGPLYARINDAPDGLADNSGSITLCLEIGALE